MIKTIIKEGGIVILLLIAIALTLGIVFYDYIPDSKTLPAKVETHAFPEDVKEELQASLNEEQNIVRTYYIDSADLSLYEATKDYDKGKVNPFQYVSTNPGTGNTIAGSSNTSTQDNQNGQNGAYFNNAGK